MSDYLRHKGKFAKKKVLDNNIKKVINMKRGKEERDKIVNPHSKVDEICPGRRIVELSTLAKNLKCKNCQGLLSLENVINEKRVGLNSILTILCDKCSINMLVPTGKMRSSNHKKNKSDVNTKAVLGTVHAGMGCTALNKLLACLNIPTISSTLFKRYEREIGPALEERARESCKQAAEEERQLVIDNILNLSKELPPEIVQEIYPFMTDLQASNAENISSLDCNNNTTVYNPAKFDLAVGQIVNIILSYDMGWSKRGNGRSYDSLNGYGTVIGFLSKKILDFSSRNRKCRLCDLGHKKEDHDCRKNFEGSAKAMEPDVGAQLLNNSTILQNASVSARVLIGDEDSSTIANVRSNRREKIFKLADKNHLNKHFVNELYGLQKQFTEMKQKKTIPHLKKCFGYAVSQNKGNASQLADALRQIPDHAFGNHENCGQWCSRKSNDDKKQTILLKDAGLYNKLKQLFIKYANNAAKFSIAASSQANESVNNIMAHKAPKNRCYSLSESADFRLASTVCTKNDGDGHLLDVMSKLNVSPGKYTESFTAKADKVKAQRAEKSKLPKSKTRRNILKQERENLRKKKENTEGINYQSNCGFDIDSEKNNFALEPQFLETLQSTQQNLVNQEDFTIVYFDLETSGFEKNADILQIAAKFKDNSFSVYAIPTKNINLSASKVTGLHQKCGTLYLRDKEIEAITLKDALLSFQEFLNISCKPCLLVAHNAAFDTGHLIRAIIQNSMVETFKNVVGFSDTLSILKKIYPERRGPGLFKLSKLAEDLLQQNGDFHEALYDVQVLQQLSSKFIGSEKLINSRKSYVECLANEAKSQKADTLMPSLKILKGIVSDNMLKKIANAGIDFNMMLAASEDKENQRLVQLLSELNDLNKPRVTKDKKILKKINDFLDNYQECNTKISIN